jgi:hypothetical protein
MMLSEVTTMIEPVANIARTNPQPPREPRAPERVRGAQPPVPAPDFPTTPPPEVLDALDTAARVLSELAASRVDLRFAVEEEATGKRVRVEVRNGKGELVREIPPKRLLDVLAGDTTGLLVDARG